MPVAPVWHRPKRSVDVAPMTAYEIISIFIGILALLMSFGIVQLIEKTESEKFVVKKEENNEGM